MKVKGIIMAGGKGSRLGPLTKIFNKHLLPVYNKPMIYYSISLLIYSNIKDIIIICNYGDDYFFDQILSDVIKKYKIKVQYIVQKNTGAGIAEGLILSRDYIKKIDKVVLLLGDNFFYGKNLPQLIKKKLNEKNLNSNIFISNVSNPENYGVAYFNKNKLIKIIEKPTKPKSNLAVTGLYIYNKNVLKILKYIKPSKRNELEITSINNLLLKNNKLNFVNIGRGTTWFDLGTFENIFLCSEYIRILELRQGLKISDL